MLFFVYKITNTNAEGAAGGFAYLNFDWTQHSRDLKKDKQQVAFLVQKYLLAITKVRLLTQLGCSKIPAHQMHSIGHWMRANRSILVSFYRLSMLVRILPTIGERCEQPIL
jgi:hypothetical protein